MHVAHDAQVAELEDRRVRVLVDRDDHVRALHADLVLDRARDPARDVELRRDGAARLADLGGVRVPAGVDDRTGRGDGPAERTGQLLDQREVLGPAEPTAAGDDDVGVLDRWTGALLVGLLEHRRRRRGVLELDRYVLHFRLAARRGGPGR